MVLVQTLILILLFSSCTKFSTLNMKPHRFEQTPTKIIWFQIAGFTEEHLAMLRFGQANSTAKTSFEKMTCSGKSWNYNLYNIRPTSHESFLSQYTGKANVKGSCDDFTLKPIWSYLEEAGFKTGALEIGATNDESLKKAWSCAKSGESFRNSLVLWSMSKAPKGSTSFFHYQEKESAANEGTIYYDKACQKNRCYSSILSNAQTLFDEFSKGRKPYLFIIRDFSFEKALAQKQISEAREILSEIEKSLELIKTKTENDDDTLILLTSAASHHFEFPLQGKQWAEFEQSGAHIIYHRPSLISPVLSEGARAENFCGIFDESDIFSRLIREEEKASKGLNLFNVF